MAGEAVTVAEALESRVNDLQEAIGRHDERIEALEKFRDKTEKTLESIDNELKNLRVDYANRPTWVVTIVITIMSTLVGTLAVYIITNLGRVAQ
jgi:sugar-specific transcriptional regulator TrmB